MISTGGTCEASDGNTVLVSGGDITLATDIDIEVTLIISDGSSLTVDDNFTLTVTEDGAVEISGTLEVKDGGVVQLDGEMTLNAGATFTVADDVDRLQDVLKGDGDVVIKSGATMEFPYGGYGNDINAALSGISGSVEIKAGGQLSMNAFPVDLTSLGSSLPYKFIGDSESDFYITSGKFIIRGSDNTENVAEFEIPSGSKVTSLHKPSLTLSPYQSLAFNAVDCNLTVKGELTIGDGSTDKTALVITKTLVVETSGKIFVTPKSSLIIKKSDGMTGAFETGKDSVFPVTDPPVNPPVKITADKGKDPITGDANAGDFIYRNPPLP